jgi:Family of unknown function (DUF6519)/Right handed beta helix region
MKGDFSRITGLNAKRKHYSGLLKQQGRVQLDSDWNELISVIAHQRGVRTIDTIGHCGAPIHNSGFEILHPGAGLLPSDLLIATGRFYSGGLLCETTPSSKLPVRGFHATNLSRVLVDDTKIDGLNIAVGQWVQLLTDEQPEGIIAQVTAIGAGTITLSQNVSSFASDHHPYLRRLILFTQQPDRPTDAASAITYAPVAGQTDLLYLDAWERHITTIEDPEIREVALGGPDTETRSKIIAQVKVLPNVGDVECGDDIARWNALTKAPNGRLTTRPVPVAAPTNPCQLGESGGFLGLENRLYRVEIHDPGTLPGTVPTFKWSRDNASYAYPIEDFFLDAGGTIYDTIRLSQNGKDDFLKIKELDWIEVSEDISDLSEDSRGTFAQILKVDGNLLTLNTNVAIHRNRPFPKIRRWDTSTQRLDKLTNITTGTGIQLEDGIEIEFSGTEFKTGDHWCFSARTLTGEIEILDKEAPLGVKHHYCRLGLVTGLAGGGVDIEDCRPEFPPLTELPRGGGCCTVTVGEDEEFQDIQLAIDSLNGGPGTVCIKPGVYVIDKPILVIGKDITIKGCEGKPIIINTGIKPEESIVFQVRNSWDINIHDLWCISTSAEGAKVIEVENCLFFTIYDCLLIGAGTNDPNGVISCQGLTINTSIHDNLILGRIGIRYDRVGEQDLNLHLNPRIVQNIAFVLEHGIFQAENTMMVGVDIDDNLLLGISRGFLGKSFFPRSLFGMAMDYGLYTKDEVGTEPQTAGAYFESVSRKDTAAVSGLESYMKVAANESRLRKARATSVGTAAMAAVVDVERTLGYVIHSAGTVVDVNISDNIIFGRAGIFVNAAIECTIDKNLILVQLEGIELGLFMGLTIDNNLIVSGQDAIVFFGQIAQGFSVSNNRINTPKTGIISTGRREGAPFQLAYNIQIDKNIINAMEVGINFSNPALFLMDLTIVDNSITGNTQVGIIIFGLTSSEQLGQLERRNRIQRVIQRNSISSEGVGIFLQAPHFEVLDNVINIQGGGQEQNNWSWGIMLMSHKCSMVNNTINAFVDIEQRRIPRGGIYLSPSTRIVEGGQHGIDIVRNTIIGGVQNGIEIASDIDGLAIEGNEIANMMLNGIATQEHVRFVNNLRIAGNHIHDCFNPRGSFWWSNAAIVLTSTRKAQIIGNRIVNNGNNLPEGSNVTGYGAFYAEQVNEIQMLNNQFINNWVLGQRASRQAIIHVPIRFHAQFFDGMPLNADIQISNNIVKGSNTRALEIGNYGRLLIRDSWLFFGLDSKAVIGNNNFETTLNGPIVQMQISLCVFSSNFASCDPSTSAVSLGFGIHVMANGNMVSDPIIGAGINQQIVNTLQF